MEEIESPGKRKRTASDGSDDEHASKRKIPDIADTAKIDGVEDGEIVEDDQNNDKESDDDCQIINDTIPFVNLDTTVEPDDEYEEKDEPTPILNENVDDPKDDNIENDEIINSESIPSDLIEIDSYTKPLSPSPSAAECLFTIHFNSIDIFNEFKTEIRKSLKLLFHKMKKTIDISENDLQLEIRRNNEDDDDGGGGSCHDSSSDDDLFGNLFTIDAAPNETTKNLQKSVVPQYSVNAKKVFDHEKDVFINEDDICKRPSKPKNLCFNCNGAHTMRDCLEPKNFAKIRENRKNYGNSRVERYHVDGEQRFGQFLPGVISENLRKALGYRSRELPMHIYRMRELGYPPGWLENAKISKSGLTLFDSKGNIIGLDKEEVGEIAEEVEYDLKKIISFPGFNVNPPSDTRDESCDYRAIPMQPHQSKQELIKMLQANSTKSYKRKKLSNLPVADDLDNNNGDLTSKESINASKNLQLELTTAEMDIDSSDDIPIIPVGITTDLSAPPLPIEPPNDSSKNTPPPPPPPPPDSPSDSSRNTPPPPPPDSPTNQIESPSLANLQKQKELLLAALNSSSASLTLDNTICGDDTTANDSLIDDIMSLDGTRMITEETGDISSTSITIQSNDETINANLSSLPETSFPDSTLVTQKEDSNVTPKTTLNKSKHHVFGTPLIESATSFSVLPIGKKWSEGVSDVIDFENLPESTGKYVQMKSVIQKVRNVVKKLNQEYENED